jgi:signal transduction histidine kinase/CheY-like chemotaxis protein
MRALIERMLAGIDAAYPERTYFTRLKARLLVGLCALLLCVVPLNVAKLVIVQPPFVERRLLANAILLLSTAVALHWARHGRLERAGNLLSATFIVCAHALIFLGPAYLQPLATAIQLFAADVVFLLVALVFASRWVTTGLVAVMLTSHLWFHHHALRQAPVAGSLEFAAGTLLRDGLLASAIVFVLGLALVVMIEAAHRRSEQALRETDATNDNLERLVAARTRELSAASERAQSSARAKSEFLANMSHEIRTPLHGIVASADLLRRRTDLPAAAADQIRVVAESGDVLLHLLGDILDFSKIEAGQLPLDPHPFSPATLVHGSVEFLAGKARLGGITVETLLPAGLPAALQGDSHRLRQVLLNLLSNAIKFTPHGGHIVVEVALENAAQPGHARLRFEVRDTGIGMDTATMIRVFERFTQADTSTTRRYGGTGLGLSISAQLVRLMGGKLEVRSVPEKGSTFSFSLEFPLTSAAPASPPPPAAAEPPIVSAPLGIRILVVEDNAVNRKILQAQLAKLGCPREEAEDGVQALAALSRAPLPDVVLMDCHMPELDGWETTRRLRAWADDSDAVRRVAARLPVIALTAAALQEERQRCRAAGMTDFVAKPVKLPELRDALLRARPARAAARAAN